MTKYGLRARVITLTLAPTLIIGLLLTTFFTSNRYNDLEEQLFSSGASILEPLAIASGHGVAIQSHEAVRKIISYAHKKNSNIVRSIAVFDSNHQLFVTSNFHPDFNSLTFPDDKPIPLSTHIESLNSHIILRTPILLEETTSLNLPLGYIAMELDLSSLRLQQYQEVLSALVVLLLGLGLSGVFAYQLMHDVIRPITNMRRTVAQISRGHLDTRIQGSMHGELNALKDGINAMAMSLSEYHLEMQQSIDQATSDLRETLEQLEIQNIELDIAKKRAQEAARVKSEFLANMSHELRTPLNGVIGFARQVLKTHLTSSQQDYIQTIERSANSLLNIISDILDFSKLEAGKLLLENVSFDFRDCLEEVLNLQATSAHEKGLEITLKVDSKIPTELIGDSLRISQILHNLVGNSIKFTEQGNIDISVELLSIKDKGVELQFMVRDTGIGISKKQQTQLFQAFSQADASISKRYGGTGLGLVITQKLIEQMKGKIHLISSLQQGSTFWFTLYLVPAHVPQINQAQDPCLLDKRILVIEPNTQANSIIEQQLKQEGLLVSPEKHIPDSFDMQDYVLLGLSPKKKNHFEEVSQWVEKILNFTKRMIIVVPSTELILAEKISTKYQVQCMTKPLSYKKLLHFLTQPQQQINIPQLELEEIQPTLSQKMKLNIMAVDDNPVNLKLITALLTERVEKVTSCSSGEKAIAQAETQKFDIILMDIQMPHVDGVTASKKIKLTKLNQGTPIIAVTAHAIDGERDRLLNAGMDDYLAKPIDEHILQQILNNWSSNISDTVNSTIPVVQEQLEKPNADVIIDWQAALKQAAHKESLAKEILQMLVDYISEVSVITQQAQNNSSYSVENLLHHIHKLHGSCLYSGVPKLKTACAEIEKHLRSGSRIEDIEPELFELQDEMESVLKAAKLYLTEGT